MSGALTMVVIRVSKKNETEKQKRHTKKVINQMKFYLKFSWVIEPINFSGLQFDFGSWGEKFG